MLAGPHYLWRLQERTLLFSFQLLISTCVPCFLGLWPHHCHLWLHRHVPSLLCASPLLSLTRTSVTGFRAYADNPEWSDHKILNFITSALLHLFTNKVTFSGSMDLDMGVSLWGLGDTIQPTIQGNRRKFRISPTFIMGNLNFLQDSAQWSPNQGNHTPSPSTCPTYNININNNNSCRTFSSFKGFMCVNSLNSCYNPMR